MGRRPLVPERLKRGAFTLDDARRAGIDRRHLKGSSWRRLGPSTYIWTKLDGDPMRALEAARLRIPPIAAFSGMTAAWLHGLDVPPCDPIEVTIPKGEGVSARAGMAVSRARLARGEVTKVRVMVARSLVRTLAELCGRLNLTEGVVLADMALHAGGVDMAGLNAWAKSHARHRGITSFRRVVIQAEPKAESPMESRLRMLIVLGGLPRPKAQVPIYDGWGRYLGRPDLYYEDKHLGIEYDGESHRRTLVEDNRRQNRLVSAGIQLLRFTASDVLRNPDSVVAQVRTSIGASAGTRRLAERK